MISQTFQIEGFDNLFEIADQSHTQITYGAVSADAEGNIFYSFYVTPFSDMVKPY